MAEMTVGAELAWRIAAIEAQRARAAHLGVEHMLIGLLSLEKALEPSAGLEPAQRLAVQQEQEQIAQILAGLSLDATTLRRALRRNMPFGHGRPSGSVSRDAACQAIFTRASELARTDGDTPCGVLHLLAALLERPPAALLTALEALAGPAALCRLTAATRSIATSAARVAAPDVTQDSRTDAAPSPAPAAVDPILPSPDDPPQAHVVPAVLLQYGRDLTAEAEAGTLPPVIGRESEMLQVVRILHRRTRSSPVLIGDAGVGKTAIVEGLARHIVAGTALPGRRIVALSLASVVAGTTYRGQFEERLEAILAALRGRPDIILFLDELHTIVGAGDRDGRLDAANMLKPALARGEIACIGATTQDEYRRHIESDPALERRFQPVQVLEPSPAEARTML
ncbi:MAG: AAA family ATPase, partial [Chloroflexota bacterium]